jgi:hypothetical protein
MQNKLIVTSLPIDWKNTSEQGEMMLHTDNPDITLATVRDLWMHQQEATEAEWDEWLSMCHSIIVVPEKEFVNVSDDNPYHPDDEANSYIWLDNVWLNIENAGHRKVYAHKYPFLTLENFGNLVMTFSRDLDHTKEHVDLGGIRLSANGRSYILDVDRSCHSGTDLVGELVRDMKELRNTFGKGTSDEDCKWDLKPKDLFSSDLKATMYIGGEDADEGDTWKVKYMYVEVHNVKGIERIQLMEET